MQTSLFEFDPNTFQVLYSSREQYERYYDTYNKELAKKGFTRIIHLLDSGEVLYDHCVSMETSKEVN